MPQLPAVLAVDGGNSKADLALLASDGTLLAAMRRPGFSHQTVGLDAAAAALRADVAELQEAAGCDVRLPAARVGVFCLAGADLPIDDQVLDTMVGDGGYAQRWLVRNDVFAVLRAGSDGGAGVAVVCGAGMNGVGIAHDGRSVRYPALGEVSGDWAAAGGWLGMRALGAAIRGADGRGAPTELTALVPAHFGLDRPLEVTEAIYVGRLPESDLRGLAPTVMACASEGDAVAQQLVQAVADEVVALVRATMQRLELLDEAVPVVLGGGLFRSADGLLQRLVAAGVSGFAPSAQLRPLDSPPVLGAALLGFDELGRAGDVAAQVTRGLEEANLETDLAAELSRSR